MSGATLSSSLASKLKNIATHRSPLKKVIHETLIITWKQSAMLRLEYRSRLANMYESLYNRRNPLRSSTSYTPLKTLILFVNGLELNEISF